MVGGRGQIQEGTWNGVLWLTLVKQEKGETDSCEGCPSGPGGELAEHPPKYQGDRMLFQECPRQSEE